MTDKYRFLVGIDPLHHDSHRQMLTHFICAKFTQNVKTLIINHIREQLFYTLKWSQTLDEFTCL